MGKVVENQSSARANASDGDPRQSDSLDAKIVAVGQSISLLSPGVRDAAASPREDHAVLHGAYGSFVPSRLHLRLDEDIEKYREPGAGDPARAATLAHEHMHYFQTIFTAYGQFSWNLHRQATAYAVTEWQRLGRSLRPAYIPLANLAKHRTNVGRKAFVASKTVDDMTSLQLARWGNGKSAQRVCDLGLMLLTARWHVNPSRRIGGAPYEICGRDILESHAQYAEAIYLLNAEQVNLHTTFSRRFVTRTYWGPWEWFLEQCPGHEGDFPYICDLALQTYNSTLMPSTEREWRASAPAWRFVALTDSLKRLRLTAGTVADSMAWYAGYANTLLNDAELPSLSDTFAQRLKNTYFNRSSFTEFEKMMINALTLRKSLPWLGANPVENPIVWGMLTDTFPMPMIEADGRLGTAAGGNQALVNEVSQELHFQALALQIAGQVSEASYVDANLECGYARFGIRHGCPFQDSHGCTGRLMPSHGIPHAIVEKEDGSLDGCQFGILFRTLGIRLEDVSFEPAVKFPAPNDPIWAFRS